MSDWELVVTLMGAVSTISYTVTSTRVFREPREWLIRKTFKHEDGEKGLLGEMVSCPYCFSHWVTYLLVALYRPALVSSGIWLLDLLVTAWVIVAGANIVTQLFRMFGKVANEFSRASEAVER